MNLKEIRCQCVDKN